MGQPRRDHQDPRVNFLLFGRPTALIVCQAMTIAITVVLPAPVASLRAGALAQACILAMSASRARSGRARLRKAKA